MSAVKDDMTLLIVNEIRKNDADDHENGDIEAIPTAHLDDASALDQIAAIQERKNDWSISEVWPGAWTRRLAIRRDQETGKDVVVR